MAVITPKRKDYISWDEYFMAVAKLAGFRSKDPNSQVGACIVSSDNKILSMGYNGFPQRTQCNLKLSRRFTRRLQDLCNAFSMQRMCKGNYSVGNKNSCLCR